VSAILQGESVPDSEIPPFVSEFFLALEFGWELEYIRTLPWHEVDLLTTLISVMYKLRGTGKDVQAKAFALALTGKQ
jgi:hypothetical protein